MRDAEANAETNKGANRRSVTIGIAVMSLALIATVIGVLFANRVHKPSIPSIVGSWSGCIQGRLGPNEAISLRITGETQEGTLTGIYGEDYHLITVIYNESTSGNWSISNSQIGMNGTFHFLTDPVKTILAIIPIPDNPIPVPLQVTQSYYFTGRLSAGKLSGTVVENNDGAERNWTMNHDDRNDCPY